MILHMLQSKHGNQQKSYLQRWRSGPFVYENHSSQRKFYYNFYIEISYFFPSLNILKNEN